MLTVFVIGAFPDVAIHRLEEQTIGQIAAGEVIERPAAVVKELIENSIDAGASRISVVIEQGGSELIEVRDDGAGIPFDELVVAVDRHTTSKLRSIDDLDRLSTLGFRGEALSAIGSVSSLEINSIAAQATSGGLITVEYGAIHEPQVTAWGAGTSARVRHLFRNLPARRKFLRTTATENAYITRIVSAYALAYPHISWSLSLDGRVAFRTDGTGDQLGAALSILSREVAEQLVPLDAIQHHHEGYDVTGIVSLPSLDRSRRDQQFFFVQGRMIYNRQLTVAFEQAYHTQLMIGRHPIGCLVLRVPADRIDVNVHPTKTQVRFADERIVFALVQRAVRATLLEHGGDVPIPVVTNPPFGQETWNPSLASDPAVQRSIWLANPTRFRGAFGGSDQSLPGPEPDIAIHKDNRVGETEEDSGGVIPMLRVLGQVAGMFITAEGPDGLYLIDQHAADERIQFERLMREYQERRPSTQQLLEPITVELSDREYEMFERTLQELSGIGFDLDPFGGTSVAIRGVPAVLKRRDPARSLRTVLDELIDGGRGDDQFESLVISAACHGSIRAGQPLSLLEMQELVRQLERCSTPMACGHGRPTIVRMTAEELAKQFSRR